MGNIDISEYTSGNLSGSDAFVTKYDANGNKLWTRQFGTGGDDASRGVSTDGLGNVYVSGTTTGDLGGANAGGNDAFVAKFDGAGNFLWTRQLGTGSNDASSGVLADGLGNAYISGSTTSNLGGTNAGSSDVFVAKISGVPEPSSLALTTFCAAIECAIRWRKR